MKTEPWSPHKALDFLKCTKQQMFTDFFLKKYINFFDRAIACNVPVSFDEDKFVHFLMTISSCPKNVSALNKLYRSASCDILFAFYSRHLLLENLFSENAESDLSYCLEMPVQDEYDQYTYLLYHFFNLITGTSSDFTACP